MSEVNYRQQWAEGEIEAGTLLDAIDALATELQARRVQVDTLTEWYANALNELGACAAALPGISYMDLPDGGSPTVAEQVARMAAECERLRECLSKANGQTEHFERNWYLVSDERDAALAELAAPPAQASAWVAERYTCIGKGGDYQLLGLAQGAGTLKGFNHMVYRNRDGVMFVREPEDFLSRMEKIAPTPGASDGKGGE